MGRGKKKEVAKCWFIERWLWCGCRWHEKRKTRKPVGPNGPGPVLRGLREAKAAYDRAQQHWKPEPRSLEPVYAWKTILRSRGSSTSRKEHMYIYMGKGTRTSEEKRKNGEIRWEPVSTGHHAQMERARSSRFTKEEKEGEIKKTRGVKRKRRKTKGGK